MLKEVTYEVLATGDKMPSGYYLKADVDAFIAELKAENEKLKQKLEDVKASMYADVVDANMKNVKLKEKLDSMAQQFSKYVVDAHNRERRLKRALYKACAMWADRTRLICSVFGSNAPKIRWERMLYKCRAKAEEYK